MTLCEIQAADLVVCTLDVWGNEEDGFEVNNTFATGLILLGGMTDDYYFDRIRAAFPGIPEFEIDWLDEGYADVWCVATGKPLLCIMQTI